MKIRHLRACLAVVPLLLSTTALGEMKIAWLSPSQALVDSDEANVWREAIETQFEPDQDEIKRLQDETAKLRQQLSKDAEVMADSERVSIAEQIKNLELDLDYKIKKLQEALQAKQREFQEALQPKLRAVIDDLIQIEGYDAIIDLDVIPNTNGRTSTIYVNPKHDITRKITELLNEKSEEG